MFAAAATAAIAAASAAPARAQIAEAETLFREGKRLLKNGQIAEACDKLDASDHLDPTVGTELNLADCREKNGQLATAWAMFVKAAAAAKRTDNGGKREAEARRRAAALEPKLVYLTISVPADSQVEGLVVHRNGAVIERALWDQRVPVDPGDYAVTAEAPGYEPWNATVAVKTRARTVEVPVLDKRPEPPPVARVAIEPVVRSERRPHEEAASWFTGRRKLALVVAAVGVGAAGVALGFGAEANSVEDQANMTCPDVACRDAHAVDLNRTARRDALIANIGLATAGAAILGAGVLWFTGGPKSTEAVAIAPVVGRDRVGFALARSF